MVLNNTISGNEVFNAVEEKLDRLERALEEFVTNVGIEFNKLYNKFRDFFPDYKGKKVVGILASLSVDESVIRYAESAGFFVLTVGDKLMEVKNSKGFKPKEW
ncbi:MAG: hypothetical protein ACK41Q_01180 [Candidatus Brocadia sp.]